MLRAPAILFDLDGVLIDSTAAIERAWTRWAPQWGLDPGAVLALAHGRRTVDTVALLLPDVDAVLEAQRLEAREAAEAGSISAYPGANRLLAGLRPGTWAVVTSGSRESARGC